MSRVLFSQNKKTQKKNKKTQKACKSLAFGSWFTSFLSVLPTSQVVYHAGKPIESVLYCFYKITMSLPAQLTMGF